MLQLVKKEVKVMNLQDFKGFKIKKRPFMLFRSVLSLQNRMTKAWRTPDALRSRAVGYIFSQAQEPARRPPSYRCPSSPHSCRAASFR